MRKIIALINLGKFATARQIKHMSFDQLIYYCQCILNIWLVGNDQQRHSNLEKDREGEQASQVQRSLIVMDARLGNNYLFNIVKQFNIDETKIRSFIHLLQGPKSQKAGEGNGNNDSRGKTPGQEVTPGQETSMAATQKQHPHDSYSQLKMRRQKNGYQDNMMMGQGGDVRPAGTAAFEGNTFMGRDLDRVDSDEKFMQKQPQGSMASVNFVGQNGKVLSDGDEWNSGEHVKDGAYQKLMVDWLKQTKKTSMMNSAGSGEAAQISPRCLLKLCQCRPDDDNIKHCCSSWSAGNKQLPTEVMNMLSSPEDFSEIDSELVLKDLFKPDFSFYKQKSSRAKHTACPNSIVISGNQNCTFIMPPGYQKVTPELLLASNQMKSQDEIASADKQVP